MRPSEGDSVDDGQAAELPTIISSSSDGRTDWFLRATVNNSYGEMEVANIALDIDDIATALAAYFCRNERIAADDAEVNRE